MFIKRLNDKSRIGLRLRAGVLVAIMAGLLTGCASNQSAAFGPVVEAEEFAALLGSKADNQLVLLDVRSQNLYDKSHVAGAVRVDPTDWKNLSLAAETGLDHQTLWKNRIGALGVSGREPVLIYDDGSMTKAARIWFIFQHFGVPQTGVLNGGYPILQPLINDGRISVSDQQTKPMPTKLEHTDDTAARVAIVERQRVRRDVERRAVQILDTRTHEEYTGEDLRSNTRGGHLPTAMNLPHTELLDEKGRLKSPATLAAILEKAGFKRGRPIVTHCDGGGRASLAALAADRAGYGPVMNYYLSFGDWAADTTCPLEKPADSK